jgi:hypothetical protein
MVFVAWVSLGVSLVALILVYRTLMATREVVVSYTDVFGERHETGYRGMLNAESLRNGKPFFQLSEEGNYST